VEEIARVMEDDGQDVIMESTHPASGGGKQSTQSNRFARRNAPYHPKPSKYSDDKSRRVYVGNLSWEVTWKELKDHMKTTGFDVTRADVLQTPDGRSKGCGIVEFAHPDGARKAVLMLNDTELMGRQIFVREDREDATAPTTPPVDAAPSSHHEAHIPHGQSRRVYVGNLSWDVAWQDLKDHMRDAGEVLYAQVMTEPDGRSKGCGIVEYQTPQEAQDAIANLTDTELKGRMIFVREDRENGATAGRGASSCSVYVGNLSYDTSWQDLKDHMRQAGNVDQANVLTMPDGRSKGCGVVLYQRPQDAAKAIRELQNSLLKGRPIFVREDREKSTSQGMSFNSGGGGSFRNRKSAPAGPASPGCQLFVGNLSSDVDWKALKDHFRPYGDVDRAEVMIGPDGRKKGFGTVRFRKPEEAQKAIQTLNGSELMGHNIEVRFDSRA